MSAYTNVTVHSHFRGSKIAAGLVALANAHSHGASAQLLAGTGDLDSVDVAVARFNHADPEAILAVVKDASADGHGYTPGTANYQPVSVSLYVENDGELTVHMLDTNGRWATSSAS